MPSGQVPGTSPALRHSDAMNDALSGSSRQTDGRNVAR